MLNCKVRVRYKMHFYIFILLYYSILPKTSGKLVEIKCPEHCKCDIFEKLRRATCTHRNLAVVESNIPQQTQLLDLSYNQIINLGDSVFETEKLLFLQLLNVSHNKVSQIHMNAFQGLTHLKTLDLSYNAIQYIIKNWFFSLGSLEELYLRGNSFSKIENEPLFASDTLKKLDLASCRISHIGDTSLSKLPNLETLDLSNNFLIQLNVVIVQSVPTLQILDVRNNSLSCDGVQQELSDYCRQKGISMENPCKIKTLQSEKFQRIVNMAPPENEKNSWIYEDEDQETEAEKNDTKIIETCNNTRTDKSLLQEIVDLSPVLSIVIPFIYGIGVGVLIAYAVHTFTENKKEDPNENTYVSFDETGHLHRRPSRFNRRSGRYSRAFSTEERQNLPLQEWNISESTPVLYRKSLPS